MLHFLPRYMDKYALKKVVNGCKPLPCTASS